MLEIAALALVFAGAAFCMIGAIGVLRLPDVFCRMHSAGIMDTIGAFLLLFGLMLLAGLTLATAKLFFIIVFLWMTSPTATHALAKAAIHCGEDPVLSGESAKEAPSSKH